MEARIQDGALPAVGWSGLCAPIMGEDQKGFKSPVYRMKIEEQKELLTMKRTTRGQLRTGDRAWRGRLGESHQPMNKNDMRGRRGGMSWHNTAKSRHSAPEVNGVVGWRRSSFLPGEICPAGRPARAGSALASNGQGDRAEVSKGNSTEQRAGGGRSPFDP
jgi:hypothetical protein